MLTGAASSGAGGCGLPVSGCTRSPSVALKITCSSFTPPFLARTRANRLAKAKYWSLVHFSIGWLWHFAQAMLMPRKATLTVSAVLVGSSCRMKKLPAPFSCVLPVAVTSSRTNSSHGVFCSTLRRIHW